MPVAARFFKSLFLLLLLNAVIKPVWIFFIDRKVQLLTGEAYGSYFSLLHLTLIPAVIADAGILAFYTRSVAADPLHAPLRFRYFFRVKLLLSVLYLLTTLLLALILFNGQTGFILSLALLQVAGSFYLFFRSHISALQLFKADAFFSVADKTLVILVAGSIIYLPGLPVIINTELFVFIQMGAFVLASIAALFFLAPHLNIKTGSLTRYPGFRKELKGALPYALVVLLMTILYRFDAFLLYQFHADGKTEASKYAGGFRLLDALNMTGFLVASFLLPLLSRGINQQNRLNVVKHCTGLLLTFSSVVAGFCWFNKEWVCNLLYGSFYPDGEQVVAASVLAIAGCSLVHIYGTVLTAAGEVKLLAICAGVFAALNITANFFVIPYYGAFGVAIIAASGQLLFGIALILICYYKKMSVPEKNYWLAAIMVPLSVFLFFLFFHEIGVPLQIFAAVMVAVTVAFGLRVINFKMIKGMLFPAKNN